MKNIIALIWDCDKTLIDGYMQDPLFRKYGVDPQKFWADVDRYADSLKTEENRVSRELCCINFFVHCAHNGIFPGLNNKMLREFGREQKFYSGVPEIFTETRNIIRSNPVYIEHGVKVEHYIVSNGFAEIIRGSILKDYVKDIWGCELKDEPDENGNDVWGEVIYTVDTTSKTRAIFEINKGSGIEVNASVPREMRRVGFENMIYIADGPSDIPAFSVIKKNGGATFAIYPKGDSRAIEQVEKMREDSRVDMYAEADYSKDTTAYLWLTNRIRKLADRIVEEEKAKIEKSASEAPKHLV